MNQEKSGRNTCGHKTSGVCVEGIQVGDGGAPSKEELVLSKFAEWIQASQRVETAEHVAWMWEKMKRVKGNTPVAIFAKLQMVLPFITVGMRRTDLGRFWTG